MITIDLLKHEQDQAEQIAKQAIGNLIDTIVLGPLLTEDQIKWIWVTVSRHAEAMNLKDDISTIANKAHNMKIKI
jgi:ABC-type iron transport system FetAB ATPase subunit